MGDNLDNFVQQLQDQIFEETKKDFGEKIYKRWCEPLYMGVIDEPDGHAKVKGKCGDTVELFLTNLK
jgi:nitrogen fixation NifU-like protein